MPHNTGRFINADAYASTGQGLIGNNMFAYCLNNPVNSADSEGTESDSYQGIIGEKIGIIFYEWITGDDHPQEQIQALENQMIEKRNKAVANGAKSLWDAYMRGYNLQLEDQLQNSMALIEGVKIMWNNPKETVDMAIAIGGVADTTYKVAMVFVAGHPASGIVISVATAAWGLYRTIEGFISASSS